MIYACDDFPVASFPIAELMYCTDLNDVYAGIGVMPQRHVISEWRSFVLSWSVENICGKP